MGQMKDLNALAQKVRELSRKCSITREVLEDMRDRYGLTTPEYCRVLKMATSTEFRGVIGWK